MEAKTLLDINMHNSIKARPENTDSMTAARRMEAQAVQHTDNGVRLLEALMVEITEEAMAEEVLPRIIMVVISDDGKMLTLVVTYSELCWIFVRFR